MDQGPFSLTTHEYIGKLTWVQVDRENTLKAAREGKNPSSAARNFKETQEGDHPIPNGRPDHGLPIGLHHSVFDQFREDVKCTVDDTITAQQYRQIATLIDISMRQYDLQEQRVKRRRSSLRTLLGMAVEVVVTDCGTKSDAVVMVPCGAFLVILEVKNEIGTGGSDPSFQGSLSYRMYWSQDRVRNLHSRSCCPSFIISFVGPWMCIQGAVLLTEVVAQPLTDNIWLGGQPRDGARLRSTAKVFHALAKGVKSLSAYYSKLDDEINSSPHPPPESPDPMFPRITAFDPKPLGRATVRFRYLRKLAEDHPTNAIFRAETLDNDKKAVVVEFVETYDPVAHELLAEHDLAPRLLSCSAESTAGGLFMVVMAFIQGPDLETAFPDSAVVPEEVRTKARGALSILHAKGIVFGDLRKPNIMLQHSDSGLKLVDFDWCAADGKGRYPVTLNEDLGWHRNVQRNGVMRLEHDMFMLEKL